jgi:DNA modification methylase
VDNPVGDVRRNRRCEACLALHQKDLRRLTLLPTRADCSPTPTDRGSTSREENLWKISRSIYRNIDELNPSAGNPRTHSKKQLKQLERSITDNKLAENAGWDGDLLKAELEELSFNLDFDLTLTGFDTPELDLIFAPKEVREEATPPSDRSQPAVSRLGDLWRIGEHTVLCGDSTRETAYRALMGNETAGLVFTDPPYNVPVAGHVSGLGKIAHAEFAMASGEMTEAEFSGFLGTIFRHLNAFSGDGSLHYICMDWRHMWEVLSAARGNYTELKNLCIWAKTNGGMGNLYRSRHELVFVFKNGTQAHINNVELGKHGRNRTNVWDYPGANSFGASRDSDLAMHPTVKPVQLVADAILDASNRGDIVLDVFGGSGTTLEAAERTGRRGRAIEIDPYYVDVIVQRLEKATKQRAVLVKGGESFESTKAWRRSGIED